MNARETFVRFVERAGFNDPEQFEDERDALDALIAGTIAEHEAAKSPRKSLRPQTELGLWVSLVVGTTLALLAFIGAVYLWSLL